MERQTASNRVVYIIYTDQMGYLATLSRHKGKLRYEFIANPAVNMPATEFEDMADELDRREMQ